MLSEKDLMPRKYQNAKLELRTDVERPYYYIRYSVVKIGPEGQRVRRRERSILGYLDEISKKQALIRRAEVLEIVNAGRVLVTSQVRFKDVAKRFLDIRVPQLGVATQNKYRTQIRNHLVAAFGEQKLCEIDGAAVEAWLTAKQEAGLGWWTRIDLKGIMSAIFTAAKAWKLWEGDNPTEGVRIGRKRLVREKRLLTMEELRTLLGALTDRPKFIVLIMFGLGLRISEVLGLRWADIDLEAKTLTVRRRWYRGDLSDEGETKSEASSAEMRLGDWLAQEFANRFPGAHRKNEFVFIGEDGLTPPDDRDILREEFRPVLKRLKLYYPGFGWHAFRRQNITWLQTLGGAKPLEAMKLGRHTSLDMTLLYTLTDAERETAQQNAMFEKLLETPQGYKH
jgi:integrase